MGLQDLIITPIYLAIFLILGYLFRDRFTTPATRKYFLPALGIRFFGAIMLGVIYQFYYGGGDTFTYFTHGSRWIYEAFWNNPVDGFRLLFRNGVEHVPNLYDYSQHIWYWRDPHSYFIVRLAFIADLFTFHTYSASSLFFALFSFSGAWAMFSAVQERYPSKTKWLAIGILFFPSLIFWGSGILKDTITLGALGWMTWALLRWIEFRQRGVKEILAFGLGLYLLLSIKIYIAICFVPMIFIWVFFKYQLKMYNLALKILMIPLMLLFLGGSAFIATVKISSQSDKYNFENVAEQARITAYDIRYGWGARLGGDGGYDIGIPDGTMKGMLALAPAAINVSLFRPYLWEVKNPLMLLSSFESLLLLVLTFIGIFKKGWKQIWKEPFLIFCLTFSLLFAFAVGVSTFNFGTLIRYKIPLIPFLIIFLLSLIEKPKHEKNLFPKP